jgi:hypothetical protein
MTSRAVVDFTVTIIIIIIISTERIRELFANQLSIVARIIIFN